MKKLRIQSAPQAVLRQPARAVKQVDQKLLDFAMQLGQTLDGSTDGSPARGVGLAAPQVGKSLRIFTTHLTPDGEQPEEGQAEKGQTRIFLNPRPVAQSRTQVFGPSRDQALLEGCLSIPRVYSPVPRAQQVRFQFEELVSGELLEKEEEFKDFAARVMLHEYDHLEGILFTDYALEYELDVYQENEAGKLEKLKDRSLLELF